MMMHMCLRSILLWVHATTAITINVSKVFEWACLVGPFKINWVVSVGVPLYQYLVELAWSEKVVFYIVLEDFFYYVIYFVAISAVCIALQELLIPP